jgi:hypothetical protein
VIECEIQPTVDTPVGSGEYWCPVAGDGVEVLLDDREIPGVVVGVVDDGCIVEADGVRYFASYTETA